MTTDPNPVVALDDAECVDLLRAESVGRLALAVAGEIDIYPINYVYSDGALYFRTAPGSKLLELSANPHAAFEIDGWSDTSAYSVVAKGVAERIERQSEIDAAEQLPLAPFVPTLKYRWVRFVPQELSGRRFVRGPEPDRF